MKKNLTAVLMLSLTVFSSGCQSSSSASAIVNSTKIYVTRSTEADSFVLLDQDDLKEKVEFSKLSRAYDFPLLVYDPGCEACMLLKKYLQTFVKETGVVFYGIPIAEYSKLTLEDSTAYPKVYTYPTVYFYSQGQTVDKFVGSPTAYQTLRDTYLTYFYDAKIYSLNNLSSYEGYESSSQTFAYQAVDYDKTSYLDEFIANKEKAAILFSWERCSDCSSLFDSYLLPYLNENPDLPLYTFEVDYFRVNKPASEPSETDPTYQYWKLWTDFGAKYGFGSFQNGKVPSLCSYKAGSVDSLAVYHNEGKAVLTEGSYSYPEAYSSSVQALKADSEEALKKLAEEEEFSQMKNLISQAS